MDPICATFYILTLLNQQSPLYTVILSYEGAVDYTHLWVSLAPDSCLPSVCYPVLPYALTAYLAL